MPNSAELELTDGLEPDDRIRDDMQIRYTQAREGIDRAERELLEADRHMNECVALCDRIDARVARIERLIAATREIEVEDAPCLNP